MMLSKELYRVTPVYNFRSFCLHYGKKLFMRLYPLFWLYTLLRFHWNKVNGYLHLLYMKIHNRSETCGHIFRYLIISIHTLIGWIIGMVIKIICIRLLGLWVGSLLTIILCYLLMIV